MPKSRQKKDRKENLLKFKNQQKQKFMSENNTIQAPEIRQIAQVPVWAQDAKFELTGSQFMSLQNFFNIYAEPMAIIQQLFKNGMESGTIQIRYQDPEGNEVPKDEVDAYIKQMQEYQTQMLAQLAQNLAPTKPTTKKLKSKKVAQETEA